MFFVETGRKRWFCYSCGESVLIKIRFQPVPQIPSVFVDEDGQCDGTEDDCHSDVSKGGVQLFPATSESAFSTLKAHKRKNLIEVYKLISINTGQWSEWTTSLRWYAC